MSRPSKAVPVRFYKGRFVCSLCSGQAAYSCRHVFDYFNLCGDLDDGDPNLGIIKLFSTVRRPRVIWLPLAVGFVIMCTIQRVYEDELGQPAEREFRENALGDLTWGDEVNLGVDPQAGRQRQPYQIDVDKAGIEWLHEIRDMRLPFRIRSITEFRGSARSVDATIAQEIAEAGRNGATVLLDPMEDSFLKAIRTFRSIYIEAEYYLAAMRQLCAKKVLRCLDVQHRVQSDRALAAGIREVAKATYGAMEGEAAIQNWDAKMLEPVFKEVAIAYSYSMTNELSCTECAKSQLYLHAAPDDLVPAV